MPEVLIERFTVTVIGSRDLVKAQRDLVPYGETALVPETRVVPLDHLDLRNAVVPWKGASRLSPDHEAILFAFLAGALEDILGPVASAYTNSRRLGGGPAPKAIASDSLPPSPSRTHTRSPPPRTTDSQRPSRRRAHTTDQSMRRKLHQTLRSELADLERASKDAFTLLDYIYKKHPPRSTKVHVQASELKTLNADTIKKVVRNALLDYHPDRQRAAAPDDEMWFVLCVEITKALTARHDVLRATA
mmetsp:Transcript_6863/g.18569  ORF Transcript_6863/g.18569 Transcript_6863/m.18569 type:complete len:246 (+) Transcript_6863:1586-2323(+)